MKKRAATLVELMVALAIAAIVATMAAALLFDGLESWRRESDRDTALRRATLATDKMAEDLAAQPDWPDLAAPVTSFTMNAAGKSVSLFITGRDSREIAVSWYIDGPQSELMRYEASADETEAALPGNAAALQYDKAASSKDRTIMEAFCADSIRQCRNVREVRLVHPGGGIPQILFKSLTEEGRSRLEGGAAYDSIPERCRIDLARPVARKE
jgi:type II secretory pathway pseudopilin PulG